MADGKTVLKREEIEAMEGLHKTHFLNPNAVRINKSLGDHTGLTGFGFHIIEVEPGHETTQKHVHYYEDECVYVLSGRATALIGDEAVQIEAGDFIAYPKCGQPHTIRNTGSETLKCIVVGERLAHDVADYPDLGKRIYRNAGMPFDLVDIDTIEQPAAGAKK